jgi:hypothetical protein
MYKTHYAICSVKIAKIQMNLMYPKSMYIPATTIHNNNQNIAKENRKKRTHILTRTQLSFKN